MKNIYVGNLAFDLTEDQVRALFESHGAVETVTIVKDRDTGRSRGFAFVEMTSDSEAETAIVALNGNLVRERQLSVNEARPKLDRVERRRSERSGERQHRLSGVFATILSHKPSFSKCRFTFSARRFLSSSDSNT
jgi:RNA recognition motif-containing protein